MKYGKPKRYSKGVQTAGKVSSALGGVADIVAINTTDDDIRKTAQYTGSVLKGVGAVAQNYKSKKKETEQVDFDDIARENMSRTHRNMPTVDSREVVNYNIDNTPKTQAEYYDNSIIEAPDPYDGLKITPNNKK